MIISVANQKGGVAKTTTALNLGAGLSREGRKVLLLDLDSQTDLTIGLGIPETKHTIDDVLNKKDINKAIVKLENGPDVIPATPDLKATQLNLKKPDILIKALSGIKNRYDFILIDTNPGTTILTVNALLASNMILIPITPEYLALRGLRDFIETIDQLNNRFETTPATIKILITNWDKRKGLHQEAIDLISSNFKKELLKTRIRTNVALAESVSHHKNIFDYQPASHGAEDYNKLVKEIMGVKK